MMMQLTETSDPYCLATEAAGAEPSGAPWRHFAVIGDSRSIDAMIAESALGGRGPGRLISASSIRPAAVHEPARADIG